MSTQENTELIKTFYKHFNAHDLDTMSALRADDYQGEAPGADSTMNNAAVRMYEQNYITAFPDLHFDVQLMVAEGDYVVANWVGTGTHSGPLGTPSGGTLDPTGKSARVPGSVTYEVKDGKISSSNLYFDMATLLGQLGLLPSM